MNSTSSLVPVAYEVALPWGPVLRGISWGDGPARVLLLHEPGADIDAWGNLPRAISHALPVRVMAVDLPGHGLSDNPWDEERLPDIVACLAESNATHARTVVIAAGTTALAALDAAPELRLAGLVLLSVNAPGYWGEAPRTPSTAKTFFAGSLADSDLEISRRLAASCGGWSSVTSIPAMERGTALLGTAWGGRISEHIVAFARDCMYPRPASPASAIRQQAGQR